MIPELGGVIAMFGFGWAEEVVLGVDADAFQLVEGSQLVALDVGVIPVPVVEGFAAALPLKLGVEPLVR